MTTACCSLGLLWQTGPRSSSKWPVPQATVTQLLRAEHGAHQGPRLTLSHFTSSCLWLKVHDFTMHLQAVNPWCISVIQKQQLHLRAVVLNAATLWCSSSHCGDPHQQITLLLLHNCNFAMLLPQTFWVPVSAWNGVSRSGCAKRGWMTDRHTHRRVCVKSECNFSNRTSDFLCRRQQVVGWHTRKVQMR